jgi:predicted ATPase with chaperone activity
MTTTAGTGSTYPAANPVQTSPATSLCGLAAIAADRSRWVFIDHAMERLNLSVGAYHRELHVAPALADLDSADALHFRHIAEELSWHRPVS